VLEIEVDQVFIKYSLIPETGVREKTQKKNEQYVSRKLTLFGLLELLCKKL
jgi:hypothetical protein